MKKLLLANALVLGTLTGSFCMLHAQEKAMKHSELVWLTDWTRAQAEAQKTGEVIFADFTGSDWCGGCIKLHNEVLVKKNFWDYAQKNLILLTIGYPRKQLHETEEDPA